MNTNNEDNIPAKLPELTDKQKEFVKAYVAMNGKATEAYLAVYKTVSRKSAGEGASRLLRLPAISQALEQQILIVKELERIDKSFIVTKLKGLVESSKSETTQLKALELLCKMAGLMQDAKANNTHTTVNADTVLFGTYDPTANKQLPKASANADLIHDKPGIVETEWTSEAIDEEDEDIPF